MQPYKLHSPFYMPALSVALHLGTVFVLPGETMSMKRHNIFSLLLFAPLIIASCATPPKPPRPPRPPHPPHGMIQPAPVTPVSSWWV